MSNDLRLNDPHLAAIDKYADLLALYANRGDLSTVLEYVRKIKLTAYTKDKALPMPKVP